MKRLIIVGSPRVEGRSGALADLLFESCIEECPEDEVYLAPVSTLDVAGCNACDFCKRKAQGAMTEQEAAEDEAFEEQRAEDEAPRRCAIRDDMDDVYPLLEDADELIVVAPVYFAGPSSQLKCMLDRFQPYFWTRTRARKRPCTLHVVGEGGDPHGFDPLVGCVRSSAAVAGFRLERVLDWVGKIDESGEIVDEADEYPVEGPVVRAFAGGKMADQPADAQELPEEEEPAELSREDVLRLNKIEHRYTAKQIEEFIDEQMTDGILETDRMDISDDESFEKLILAYDISMRKNSRYRVQVEEEQVSNGNYCYPKMTFRVKQKSIESEQN